MNKSEQKVVQYLNEAHSAERSLVSVLQSQIAIAPRGSYRRALEAHLGQTRDHASRVQRRLRELDGAENPLQAGLGLVQNVVGQALALGKTPLDLVRGSGGEEKVLKDAKYACATEALEIATYTAIERLAISVGDSDTEALAKSIRNDEQKMLDSILEEIPKLTDAVVQADVHGNGSYDITETGAADACARSPTRPSRPRETTPRVPSATPVRHARCPASLELRARSRARSHPRATWRSPATTR